MIWYLYYSHIVGYVKTFKKNLCNKLKHCTTKPNHLLTEKSRTIYRKSMHVTVKCDSVGVLVQQNIDKVLCEITQVSARYSKKRYL